MKKGAGVAQAEASSVNEGTTHLTSPDEARLDSAKDFDSTTVKKLGALKGASVGFLAVFMAVLVFSLGNICAYLGLIDIGRQFSLQNPWTQSAPSSEEEVSTKQLAARLDEVAGFLDKDSLYRYTQGDLDTATAAAIKTLLGTSEDPYAVYYTPEQFTAYRHSSEGEYSGIGIVLALMGDKVVVVQVYEGSAAGEAGVLPGDVIVAVDGDQHEWELDEVTDFIRRPAGESVSILWRRGDTEFETELTLREVNIPTIVSHLIEYDGQLVGYVYLRRFNTHSASELGEALRQLEASGAQGFILDLRGNPGGYLTQAIEVTSLFVEEGVVVQIEGRSGIELNYVNGKTVTNKPLAVLIDASSASASELVCAALQDHERAIIVGEPSYGKGTVQDISLLSWGGAIKYTIAHYLSPEGKTLDGVGVTPDIIVSSSEPVEDFGLEDMITNNSYRYRKSVDPQLDAALEALRADLS